MLSINRTLAIINEILIKITPYYKYEKYCIKGLKSRIDNIIGLSEPLINECWEAYWSNCFEEIEDCFLDIENDDEIKAYLQNNNLEFAISWGEYEPSTYFKITVISKINNREFILLSENIAEYSVTIFKCINLESRICFIYCHKYIPESDENDKNFIVFKKIMPQKLEGRFWLEIDKKNKKNLRFSYDTIKREFKELLENVIVPYLNEE